MESLANVFVMLGLLGYIAGRRRMLRAPGPNEADRDLAHRRHTGLVQCATSLVLGTAIGVTAKETAVMLPLYAFLVELLLFRFRGNWRGRDPRVIVLFLLVLVIPMWPVELAAAWSAQVTSMGDAQFHPVDEAPQRSAHCGGLHRLDAATHAGALSFYHDDFIVSRGLLSPWTSLVSIVAIAGLLGLAAWSGHANRWLPWASPGFSPVTC